MGIFRDFINAMRQPSTCDGCGRDRKVCDRACREYAAVELEWQQAIK